MSGISEPRVHPRIYLDTNVFIDTFEGRGAVAEALVGLFLAESPGPRQPLVTSELTLSELIVKPLELGRTELVHIYDNWTITNEQIEVVPVVRTVLRTAAELRAGDGRLKLPDAIHLATAVAVGCTHFLSRDIRLNTPAHIRKVVTSEEAVRALLKELSAHAH